MQATSAGCGWTTLLNGVFVDRQAGPAFRELYEAFTGRREDFEGVVYESKKLVMRVAMPARATGSEAWGDTTLVLPDSLGPRFRDILTGRELRANGAGRGRRLRAADVFAALPVALLEALP